MQHKDTTIEREYSQTMVKVESTTFDTSRPLGSYTDNELFAAGRIARAGLGERNKPMENILYKVKYQFNGEKVGVGRYVEKTDTMYVICGDADGGVSMDKSKEFQILGVICEFPKL